MGLSSSGHCSGESNRVVRAWAPTRQALSPHPLGWATRWGTMETVPWGWRTVLWPRRPSGALLGDGAFVISISAASWEPKEVPAAKHRGAGRMQQSHGHRRGSHRPLLIVAQSGLPGIQKYIYITLAGSQIQSCSPYESTSQLFLFPLCFGARDSLSPGLSLLNYSWGAAPAPTGLAEA